MKWSASLDGVAWKPPSFFAGRLMLFLWGSFRKMNRKTAALSVHFWPDRVLRGGFNGMAGKHLGTYLQEPQRASAFTS